MHNGRMMFNQPSLGLVVSLKFTEMDKDLRQVEFVRKEGDPIALNEVFQLAKYFFDGVPKPEAE